MSSVATSSPTIETLADLLDRLGGVPPDRIRFHPYPGTATEEDVLARPGGVKRLCELVDGVLVEKAMGYYESLLAAVLIGFLRDYLKMNDQYQIWLQIWQSRFLARVTPRKKWLASCASTLRRVFA